MNKEELKKLIDSDDDTIYSPKNSNSLKEFLKNNPDGTDDLALIARALMVEQSEVQKILDEAIQKLRKKVK